MRIDDRAAVKNCFEKIDQSSKYLLSLINDILCMSKIESGKIRLDIGPFKLEELFGGLWQLIETQAADKNITYRCTGLENVRGSYDGDVTKIHQVLINLLTNAVKFTPHGGEVTLSVKESGRDGKYTKLLFSVTDTGCGISEEFMDRLFLPFEQEKSGWARNLEGTGLGLAIVYSLVKLMDGTVSVRSKKGEMSRFEVMLPVLAAGGEALTCGEEEQPSGAAPAVEDLRGMRILIAEDNEINMEIAKSFLNFKGALVDTSENGAAAVNINMPKRRKVTTAVS
ncbi:MAG: ATP-binding protein [Synergistaceae bacterium]|nr:ATP-binding protein [Synergistaceae bacterium]